MARKSFFKPLKKYISKNLAMKKLRVTPREFCQLVVLCGIYPLAVPEKNCLGLIENDWYYSIEDIKNIYYSDAYDTLRKNASIEKKKQYYFSINRMDKVKNFRPEQHNLVKLVKYQYPKLGDAINKVGESLRNLYFIKMLGIDNVDNVLKEWEEFIVGNRLLEKGFLSKKGTFFSFDIENIKILWSVPYPAEDFSHCIEEKKDIEKKIKKTIIKAYLDFDQSSEYEESESNLIDTNDPDRLDISLLKYASGLHEAHVRLIINKLQILYGKNPQARQGIFKNVKIHILIKSIAEELEFILKNEEAELVSEKDAYIIIAESVDSIKNNVSYVQPQYILDSLNAKMPLDVEIYKIGKPLPKHISPFPDILSALDERTLKMLSNNKKYKILDKVQALS